MSDPRQTPRKRRLDCIDECIIAFLVGAATAVAIIGAAIILGHALGSYIGAD